MAKSISENIIDRSSIIGSSHAIMSSLNAVSQCAKSQANVLITGQTGTGKELFANTIHINSSQKENRLDAFAEDHDENKNQQRQAALGTALGRELIQPALNLLFHPFG